MTNMKKRKKCILKFWTHSAMTISSNDAVLAGIAIIYSNKTKNNHFSYHVRKNIHISLNILFWKDKDKIKINKKQV